MCCREWTNAIQVTAFATARLGRQARAVFRVGSEEHTSELQSHSDLVCRLLLAKKKTNNLLFTTRLLSICNNNPTKIDDDIATPVTLCSVI